MTLSQKLYGVPVTILATLVILSAITYFTQEWICRGNSRIDDYAHSLAKDKYHRMLPTDKILIEKTDSGEEGSAPPCHKVPLAATGEYCDTMSQKTISFRRWTNYYDAVFVPSISGKGFHDPADNFFMAVEVIADAMLVSAYDIIYRLSFADMKQVKTTT